MYKYFGKLLTGARERWVIFRKVILQSPYQIYFELLTKGTVYLQKSNTCWFALATESQSESQAGITWNAYEFTDRGNQELESKVRTPSLKKNQPLPTSRVLTIQRVKLALEMFQTLELLACFVEVSLRKVTTVNRLLQQPR